MKTLEFLKKISFREGFFFIAMLVAVALYAIDLIRVPTIHTLFEALWVLLWFLLLCFLIDFFKFPSQERADRMCILAAICLGVVFIIVLALAFYCALVADIIFTGQFFGTLCLIFFIYLLTIMLISSGFFFNYIKPEKEITGGLKEVKK